MIQCLGSHWSGRLREQRGGREEAALHQGGRGGVSIRGGELSSRQHARRRQAGPGPALPHALPPALAAAAAEALPSGERRSRPALQPADPRGELQRPAAGSQPAVSKEPPGREFIHSVGAGALCNYSQAGNNYTQANVHGVPGEAAAEQTVGWGFI